MSVHALHACHDDALDVIAMTDERAKELVKPILREILELRELSYEQWLALRERKVEILIDALRLCCAFNDGMRDLMRDVVGQLDEMIAVVERLNVKALAAELRPHLAVIAKPEQHDGTAYVRAILSVRDVIAATPVERLAGGGLQRALSPGRHALLMGLIGPESVPTREAPGLSSPLAAGGLTTPVEAAA